jgi:hypothetical protein
MTPCTESQAEDLLVLVGLRDVPVRFLHRPTPGRARFNRFSRHYGISLPGRPGTVYGFLRAGIVLHEAAHVLDHQRTSEFSHGPTFCRQLLSLIEHTMTTPAPTINLRQIYDRHQGPYVILLIRTDAKGKQTSDRVLGTHRAEFAHQQAVDLVTQDGDVTTAYIFSDTEGQFTGALYRRGETYASWVNAPLDDAPPAAPKLKDLISNKAPAAPRAPRPAKLPGDRFPVMRGRPLTKDPAKDNDWPKSAPAQLVRSHFDLKGATYSATSAELVAEIGQALQELGMAHPASLISRLKQSGLLTEGISHEQDHEGQEAGEATADVVGTEPAV